MKSRFGGYVEIEDPNNYYCRPCGRWFFSKTAILSHCRSTSAHAWCERCERVFLTEEAKQKHIEHSASHAICSLCDHRPDFATRAQLLEHYQDVHFPCQTGTCNFVSDTDWDLQDHLVSQHFACEKCFRTFENQNNLNQHLKAHEDKDLACPVCCRRFARQSHVLLHLERSRCGSIKKVNALASAYAYLDGGHNIYDPINDKRRFCCEMCGSRFDQLSSLFQHAEDIVDCSYTSTFLHDVAHYIFRKIIDCDLDGDLDVYY